MKTKTLLQTTGLTILTMLLTTIFSNAQIPIQGLAVDHEGVAFWDADGSGPEPAATGHISPNTGTTTYYYSASRDYDDIDPDPNASYCHFLDDIDGFPLFVEALDDNGFSPGQVKINGDLFTNKDDIEGEDWFIINNNHYINRYGGHYYFELNGEPMISLFVNYVNSYLDPTWSTWMGEGSFSFPEDASENSSAEVQNVAAAFLADMGDEQLRIMLEDINFTGEYFNDNGRNGAFVELISGYLEKGMPQLPFRGRANDNEGIAAWNADGTGPEPEATGHTFEYDGVTRGIGYYIASRDYDDIDPNPYAASCHFTDDDINGFPNLELQLTYRDYNIYQLKVKTGISTLGDDIEGEDWGLDGSIHWYNYYGTPGIFEIDGEPILQYVVDTNFSFNDLDNPNEDWWSYTSYATITDISANASSDAQYVAASFLKDLGNRPVKSYMEGHVTTSIINSNGRSGAFTEISNGILTTGYPDSLIDHLNESFVPLSEIRLVSYPNPFSTQTTFTFELTERLPVKLEIYNVVGRKVENLTSKNMNSGKHTITWAAPELPEGIYFCRLQAGSKIMTRKIIKVK